MSGYYWLASYPKSGNTWLRLFLRSVMEGGAAIDFTSSEGFAPIASARAPFDALLCTESSDLTDEEINCLRPRFYEIEAALADEPLLRKVHDAWVLTKAGEPMFPPAMTLGAVYVVRDPRDVAVSLAHHYGFDIDAAIAMMANSGASMAGGTVGLSTQFRQPLLTWSGHVETWLDHASIRRICIRYEDMKTSPETSFRQVVAFLGWAVSPEILAAALTHTRFEFLQMNELEHGFRERGRKAGRFFRRGEAGGWRDSLTPEQTQRILDSHGPVMSRLGYL